MYVVTQRLSGGILWTTAGFFGAVQNLDVKLRVLVSLEIDRYLRTYPDAGKHKEQFIDRILVNAGMSQGEAALLLNKSQQAVSNMVSKG
jgi:hypothetical protein